MGAWQQPPTSLIFRVCEQETALVSDSDTKVELRRTQHIQFETAFALPHNTAQALDTQHRRHQLLLRRRTDTCDTFSISALHLAIK
eukprot:SAG31_NODE_9861_length_1219_cov_1.800893_2_plen_85_part_01